MQGEASRKRDAIVKIVCDCRKKKKREGKKEETGQGIENGLSCQLRGDPYLLTSEWKPSPGLWAPRVLTDAPPRSATDRPNRDSIPFTPLPFPTINREI